MTGVEIIGIAFIAYVVGSLLSVPFKQAEQYQARQQMMADTAAAEDDLARLGYKRNKDGSLTYLGDDYRGKDGAMPAVQAKVAEVKQAGEEVAATGAAIAAMQGGEGGSGSNLEVGKDIKQNVNEDVTQLRSEGLAAASDINKQIDDIRRSFERYNLQQAANEMERVTGFATKVLTSYLPASFGAWVDQGNAPNEFFSYTNSEGGTSFLFD